MGDLSVYASRFSVNSQSLKDFDKGLRYITKKKKLQKTSGEEKYLSKILNVLDPIVDSLQRHFSESTLINERNVIEIIKNRHDKNWPTYKEKIILLHQKLHENKMTIFHKDIKILNDIADALDSECAYLFRRLSERK